MFLASVTRVSKTIQMDPGSENQIFKRSEEIMQTLLGVRLISEDKDIMVAD